jgi:hypothetical protein
MEFVGVNIFEVEDDQLRSGRFYTELVRDAGGVEQQLERMTRSADSATRRRPLSAVESPVPVTARRAKPAAAHRADSAPALTLRQIGLRQPSVRWRRPCMAAT